MDGMRLDKWLWAARWYKTRALATEDIDRGRVRVNGMVAKPSRELRPGDTVEILQTGGLRRALTVRALSLQRGPASVAQRLYEEWPDSLARLEAHRQLRREAPEPALALPRGRPTKRDRRALDQARGGRWNDRWSASID